MTNVEFVKRCEALFGYGWMMGIQRMTRCGYSSVKRWAAGQGPVPPHAVLILVLAELVPPEKWPRELSFRGKRKVQPAELVAIEEWGEQQADLPWGIITALMLLQETPPERLPWSSAKRRKPG